LSLTAPTGVLRPGSAVSLQVILHASRPKRAVQFGLQWDPTILRADPPAIAAQLQSWATANAVQLVNMPAWHVDNTRGAISAGGVVVLGGPASSGLTPEAPLVSVSLTALAPGTTVVHFTDVEVIGVGPDGQPVKVANVSSSGTSLSVVPPTKATP
jgi:hypothetical protein